MTKEEDLGQAPSEAGEKRGSDHQSKPHSIKSCLARDHHHNANGHCHNDQDQLNGWVLEPEKKGEEKDKGEGG